MISLAIRWGEVFVAMLVPVAVYTGKAAAKHYFEKKKEEEKRKAQPRKRK